MDVKPRNLDIPLPEHLEPIEYWWEPGSSSPGSTGGESEYDCGYLDLGAGTPNSNIIQSIPGTPRTLSKRRSFLRSSSPANKPNRLSKYGVDRDCGICFEYAVLPCRTLCCGKVFCTEHLADWLHGPEAEGRCPNCENACSLAGGTLSLATSADRRRYQAIHSSPSTLIQPHLNDTLRSSHDRLRPPVASTQSSSTSSPTCSYSSTADYSETTVSSEESKEQHHIPRTFRNEDHSTNSFLPSRGVASRLVSIVIFLMFLYKLRS